MLMIDKTVFPLVKWLYDLHHRCWSDMREFCLYFVSYICCIHCTVCNHYEHKRQ